MITEPCLLQTRSTPSSTVQLQGHVNRAQTDAQKLPERNAPRPVILTIFPKAHNDNPEAHSLGQMIQKRHQVLDQLYTLELESCPTEDA